MLGKSSVTAQLMDSHEGLSYLQKNEAQELQI